MSVEETVVLNLDINESKAESKIRRIEFLVFRFLGLLKRFCGDENVDKVIGKLQHLTMTVRVAHSAIIAFEAASGPVGWAFAIVAGISAAATASDFMLSLGE